MHHYKEQSSRPRLRLPEAYERQPGDVLKLRASTLAVLAGLSVFAAGPAQAADEARSTAELREENARLRQELEALKHPGQAANPSKPLPVGQAPAETRREPAPAADAAGKGVVALDQVVITSRNREEIAQDVPLPVSVIGGKQLERDNAVTVTDLTKKAPNLLVNSPNARQTSIAIRGLGKNSANDSMEPSVGVIVDNVFTSHVGMSWADFIDVDRVEVARGPQGTLLGKNTTLGVLNVVTKKPSFTPEFNFETSAGTRDTFIGKFSASGPLAEGLLAYRASFYSDRRGGTLDNTTLSGEKWLETNRFGGRFQLLFTPTDTLSARLIADHAESNERINIQPYQADPARFADGSSRTSGSNLTYSSRLARSYFGGYQPLIGSRDTIDTNEARPLSTKQNGVSAEINWDVLGHTLTSISSYRELNFDATNDGDQTKFSIARNGTLLSAKGTTQEFRLTSPVGGAIDYQTGLFWLNSEVSSTSRNRYGQDAGAFYARTSDYNALMASGFGRLLLKDALNGVFFSTETRPKTDSLAAFGQLNWHWSKQGTLTLGVRDTREKKTNDSNKVLVEGGSELTAANYSGLAGYNAALLANARNVRANQVKNIYGFKEGISLDNNSVSWLLNPSYKLTPDILVYASAAYGEKSGAVQFDSLGNPANVKPEKALDFELGFKSVLLDKRLMLNVNLYQTDVRDYQAQLQQVNPTSSTDFTTALSNVKRVQARGLEIDGAYRPFGGLTLSFNGSYNRAIYKDFRNATCTPEANTTLPCDYSGRQLPYAPKVLVNLGVDYRHAIGGGLVGHVFVNDTYRSRANLSTTLSDYGWQDAYHLTDAGIGISTANGKYDLDLVAKNIGDTRYATSIGDFSNSAAVAVTPGDRRYIGLVFRGRL